MNDLRLSWSRDDEGVITVYATDPNTGRIAEVADLWTRPLRERLGLSNASAKGIQQQFAETLVENWNAPEGREAMTDRTVPDPHLAAYAKGLEDAAHCATSFLVGDPHAGVPLRNPMPHEIAARLRALSPLPPGSRVVVVPPEGSEAWATLIRRAYRLWRRAIASDASNEDALSAALRALTGGDVHGRD